MKRIVLLLAVFLVFFSCATKIGSTDPQEVINTWAKGLEEKNLSMIMSTYWPEAEAVYIDPEGNEQVNSGSDAIREMQKGTTENEDFSLDVWHHEAVLKVRGDKADCTVKVQAGEFTMTNILELEKRDGRWGIIRQVIK